MSLVTMTLVTPVILHFTLNRSNIHSFEEIHTAYLAYMVLIRKARSEGRKLSVVLNLEKVTYPDLMLWSYVKRMRAIVGAISSEAPVVTKVTVKLPYKVLRPVLNSILPYCVGQGTELVII